MSDTSSKQLNVHIRWMIRRDMNEVLGIEESAYQDAWVEEDFIDCLRQRNCIGMVAEINEPHAKETFGDDHDAVVGFMIYQLHKKKLHVLNFAVNFKTWRRGVGRQMIQKLKSKLSRQRRNKIVIEVSEDNINGQLFLKSQGFEASKVIRDHYENGRDAYQFVYRYAGSIEEY